MPPAPTEATLVAADRAATPQAAAARHAARTGHWRQRAQTLGPAIGLVALCIAGTLLNGDFATSTTR